MSPKHEKHGKILRRSLAMSGSAWLNLPKNPRRGLAELRGRAHSSQPENDGLVVGLAVFIADINVGVPLGEAVNKHSVKGVFLFN